MKTASIKRHPERAFPGGESEILLQGLVAHVAFCQNGRPVVIPLSYHYGMEHPHSIYLHGSRESRALRMLVNGAPVCIEVTLLDGLVYSRSAMYHSMNYRSVVCFGRSRLVEDQNQKAQIFEAAVRRYFPGRTEGHDYAAATTEQWNATMVIEVQIEEWSAKKREGGPKGPRDAEPDAPGTCGVLPL